MTGRAGQPTLKKHRWYNRRDVRFLVFVAIMLAAYFGYGYVTGPGRISDELREAMRSGQDRLDIVVTSKFPAEEFHIGIYQDVGNIRGTDGKDTLLYAVRPRGIRMLSRKYWIEWIDLAPKDEAGDETG